MRTSEIRLGIVRGISFGLLGTPDEFVPQMRELGANLVRVFFYWSQIEPRPGDYRFDAVDALLDQLDGSEEVWVTVCSSSLWATKVPSEFLPPSRAKDLDVYREFIRRLVERCAGRVKYWQCDNEPANSGLLWAGDAQEYVDQLAAMYESVKSVDPSAAVVLGGAPHGTGWDAHQREFFAFVLDRGRDAYDLFDIHLYGPVESVLDEIAETRRLMRVAGHEKEIIVGEYNGPWARLYPEAAAVVDEARAVFDAALDDDPARAAGEAPERDVMRRLYGQMDTLPPTLQMFMEGCPEELAKKRDRINRREIVMRNVLALSAGVRRTACWNLAPETPDPSDRDSVFSLLFDRFPLLAYANGEIRTLTEAAKGFALMAEQLAGVETVTRREAADPATYVFDVVRAGRGPMFVAWRLRDSFAGEDEPPTMLDLPWAGSSAVAIDALGAPVKVHHKGDVCWVPVSVTPVFVREDERP